MSKTLRDYQDGEVIFAEGDAPTAAFVLVEGNVELLQNSDAGQVTLAFLQPGETFGDMSVMEGAPHQATARAVGTASVEIIPRKEFVSGVTNDPASAMGLIQSLIGRLRGMNARAAGGADASAPLKPAGGGLLGRLFSGGNRLVVHVAPFSGGDPALARQVAQLLSRRPGVRAKPLRTPINAEQLAHEADENAPVELVEPRPEEKAARHLAAVVDAARTMVRKSHADLLIWGMVAEPGATITLYFTSARPEEEDRPGLFADLVPLKIPATVTPEWSDLLYGTVLAAAYPKDEAVEANSNQLLPRAMDAARDFVANLPFDLTTDEQASARLAFANVAARTAALHVSGHLFGQAAQLYAAAVAGLDKGAQPLLWAVTQRNLGVAWQGMADAGGDETSDEITPGQALEKAADAYRAATQVLSKDVLPLIWASVQNRLGLTLYKLDAKTQDAEILKHTLSAYQAALQVFSPQQSPLRWAEVMHNLAQAAQVLGGQLHNEELLKKAVDACTAALRVRNRDSHPFLWASTQNNLGSALFLLGRNSQEREPLEQAADAFAQVRDFYSQLGNANPAAIAGRNLAHVEKILDAIDKQNQPSKPPRMKWEPPDEPPGVPGSEAPPTTDGEPAPAPETTEKPKSGQ